MLNIKSITSEEDIIPINLDAVTLQDCLDLYYYKNKEVLINDGHIVDIVYQDN